MDRFQHGCHQPVCLLLYAATHWDGQRRCGNPRSYIVPRGILEQQPVLSWTFRRGHVEYCLNRTVVGTVLVVCMAHFITDPASSSEANTKSIVVSLSPFCHVFVPLGSKLWRACSLM